MLLAILTFLALGVDFLLPPARALASDVGPFGSTETASHNVKMFHKWIGMLERNRRDQTPAPAAASEAGPATGAIRVNILQPFY